jgi:hypothetical protein
MRADFLASVQYSKSLLANSQKIILEMQDFVRWLGLMYEKY